MDQKKKVFILLFNDVNAIIHPHFKEKECEGRLGYLVGMTNKLLRWPSGLHAIIPYPSDLILTKGIDKMSQD